MEQIVTYAGIGISGLMLIGAVCALVIEPALTLFRALFGPSD